MTYLADTMFKIIEHASMIQTLPGLLENDTFSESLSKASSIKIMFGITTKSKKMTHAWDHRAC